MGRAIDKNKLARLDTFSSYTANWDAYAVTFSSRARSADVPQGQPTCRKVIRRAA